MRNDDPFFIPVKFDHHEFGLLVGTDTLSIFLGQMSVWSKSFQSIRQLNNRSFIIAPAYGTLVDCTDRKCILQSVPGIFLELLMTQLQFPVIFIDTHYDHIDMGTNLCILT